MSGAAAGRRAVLRWAWRLFRREWRQQLLVLALVTVAVGGAVAFSSMAVASVSAGKGVFGKAGALMHVDASDRAVADATVAAARARFGPVEVIGHTEVAVPGSSQRLDLRAQSTHGRFSGPTLALRSGRYPTTASEIALTPKVVALLATHVGASVRLGRVTRVVVGIVENPGALKDAFGLLAPSTVASADSLTLFITSVHMQPASQQSSAAGPPTAFRIEGAPRDHNAVVASVVAVTTVAMALVALIAAAGFVVVAQRRQRQLGLLDAIGATARHLRLVMVANGAIVGAVAAVVGGALGLVGWIIGAPAIETAIGHRVDRWALPWGLIAICLILAVVASTAAAWWPARMMARQPTMSALSRRPAHASPVHRSLASAVAFLALGAGLIVVAHPTGETVSPLPLLSGLVAMIAGVVLLAPAAVRVLAWPARRLPFAPRLALRYLVRNQARAAAALAAIALGLGVSVTILVLAQANQYKADEGNLAPNQLLIRPTVEADPAPTVGPPERAGADLDAAATAVAASIPGARLIPLYRAFNATTIDDPNLREPIQVATPIPHGFRGHGEGYVATPALLAALHLDPTTLKPTADLVTSSTDNVGLFDPSARPEPGGASGTHVQRVNALSAYTSTPSQLITQGAVDRHGWVTKRAAWFLTSDHALTTSQIAAARKAAAATELNIEARSTQDDLATLRTGATAVGVLLALAIVAMTLGLLRGEAAADLRTLTATGASATTRRALTATTAAALGVLGVVLSTGGAYAAMIAAYHAELDKLVPIPAVHLLLLAIGLPVLAAAGGWLLAGREPVAFSRQLAD